MENKTVPNWIIKAFNSKNEDDDLSFWVASVIAFYFVGIVWSLKFIPFEILYIIIEIICIAITSALFVWLYHWVSDKVEILKTLRKEALLKYRDSETKKEKEDSLSELKRLRVFL